MGRFSPGIRVGSWRCPVTGILEEWSSSGGDSVDKIRLTDPPRTITKVPDPPRLSDVRGQPLGSEARHKGGLCEVYREGKEGFGPAFTIPEILRG